MRRFFLILINIVLGTVIVIAVFFVWLQKDQIFAQTDSFGFAKTINVPIEEKIIAIKREKVPEREVKAIYVTSNSAANSKRLEQLVAEVKANNLNAMVIDIKDYNGKIVYNSQLKLVQELQTAKDEIKDISTVIQNLHAKGLYVIARLPVFQDLELAEKKPEWAVQNTKTGGVWKDKKGLGWMDASNANVWQYNLDLAKEAAALGFDEINFDYIRFPSDGNLSTMGFNNMQGRTKREVMKAFFKFLGDGLKDEPVYTSVDLFGLTSVRLDDMNIGQNIEDAGPYIDYICPMVYPSHYPTTYLNFKNPADHPYEIIFNDLKIANERLAKLQDNKAKIRPWLQAFDMGAIYTPAMTALEVKATKDSGSFGYLFWNARNVYEPSLGK
jgi:hypothetical protein